MTARILDIDPAEYHLRDGLSASIATTLIARSPLHAFTQHPRLGAVGKEPTKFMDGGCVIHTLTLGKGKRFCVLDFKDYKTKAAQEARDAARARGETPILAREMEAAEIAAAAISIELAERGIFLDGQSEVAIEWEEPSSSGPVLCRGMFDHAWLDAGRILDLKITGDAAPGKIERSAENFGYAIQAAAYTSALAALKPELAGKVDFLIAFCEPTAPHAMNLTRGDGTFREIGERRWRRAVETWGQCLAENRWPAYGRDVNPISTPLWALAKEEQIV